MKKKKWISLVIAGAMVLGLTACGKKDEATTAASGGGQSTQAATQAGSSEKDTGTAASTEGGGANSTEGAAAQTIGLTGKLLPLNADDPDLAGVLRGVNIAGNQFGSGEFNSRDKKLEGVRDIFALNEWVEFYPDTDKEYGIKVWVVTHRDDIQSYEKEKFSDLMKGFAHYCELHFDPDAEANAAWGSFYLNPDEHAPGYYDFVFTYEGKAFAVLVTRFYNEADLDGKSDADLEKLMVE